MVFIATALQCEAAPIIRACSLKKLNNDLSWSCYGNDSLCLFITGVGPIAASAAVSAVLSKYECSKDDCLINIGSCCEPEGSGDIGSIYLINKLTDRTTGRSFYPDMLLRSGLAEREIISSPNPVGRTEAKSFTGEAVHKNPLFDMEAAFIYQAAKYYLGPSQISFLKIVSDNGIALDDSPNERQNLALLAKRTEELIEEKTEQIKLYISSISEAADDNKSLPGYEKTDELAADFKCSKVMKDSLLQLQKYAEIAGVDYRTVLAKFYSEERLPVKSKKDGLKLLAELKSRLLK